MGEDGIVVGLDDADGERESGEDILDRTFGGIDGHFFMELDRRRVQQSMAVN